MATGPLIGAGDMDNDADLIRAEWQQTRPELPPIDVPVQCAA